MTRTAFSYVSGVGAEPLLGSTIGQALASAATLARAAGAGFAQPRRRLDLEGAAEPASRDLAAGLLALGLERGERIGVWSLNRPEWTLTQFAAAEAGLVFVTINPAYRLT